MPMKELVDYVAKSLVDDPNQVHISEASIGADVHLELMVAADDRGRVIGQNGRIANAIRSLLWVTAAQEGHRVTFDIV
jgi:uncharacterized protein